MGLISITEVLSYLHSALSYRRQEMSGTAEGAWKQDLRHQISLFMENHSCFESWSSQFKPPPRDGVHVRTIFVSFLDPSGRWRYFPHIRWRQLPRPVQFAIYQWSLPCGAVFYELLNASLNKLKIDEGQAVKYNVLCGRFFIFVHKDYKICVHEKYRPLL